MSTLFNNTTPIAVIAALIIGMLLGAKFILFLATIFRGIIGPSYPPGGYQNPYPNQYSNLPHNQHPNNGTSTLMGILLALFVIAFIVFMAKSMLNNLFDDKKTEGKASSSGLTVNKNAEKTYTATVRHPVNEQTEPPVLDENIPAFVTVQDLPAAESTDDLANETDLE